MHKFFSNRKWVIVIVCLVLSIGFMTLSVSTRNNRAMPPFIQRFGNDIVGIADTVVAFPINTVRHGSENINNLINTYKENQRLKTQVDNVVATKVKNQAVEQENSQLKRQLKMNSGMTDYTPINAEVLSRTPSAWQNQLIINKGQSAGVKKYMPVLGGNGLIGRISEVNTTNSKVELISNNSDSNNKFSVQIINRKGKIVNGLINGFDRSTGELVMGHLNTKIQLQKGDKVSTNGLGGITPKGLYVGSVSKNKKDDYGTSSKIYIKSPSDINDLEAVTVAAKQQ
ncbi:rod shape-determining protein MreC [Apilactobacillus apisilvae]|uniref:Cell shape-determining protein MreC n=1 Tax=Apilactobacillus apisilvae TaxID=2923364 RepID=A0ABY4PH93_9LACO|nr:rod shape-determining protein MreC [Apilactobacillus apisilvae]UQS85175.1 rod shape-determining protein MreC [Apilactobacillus apisilvae]